MPAVVTVIRDRLLNVAAPSSVSLLLDDDPEFSKNGFFCGTFYAHCTSHSLTVVIYATAATRSFVRLGMLLRGLLFAPLMSSSKMAQVLTPMLLQYVVLRSPVTLTLSRKSI